MDARSIDLGFSGKAFTQTSPSGTAAARQSPVAPQRARAASAESPRPETSAGTRRTQPSKGLVEEVAFANAIAEFLNQKVSFNYDERIDQIVVKVTRGDDEEVIRQIPSEEMITLMTKFRKDFRGLIFDRTG